MPKPNRHFAGQGKVVESRLIAPELAFTFRVSLTAEGDRPIPDVLARLNEVLGEIQEGWELA